MSLQINHSRHAWILLSAILTVSISLTIVPTDVVAENKVSRNAKKFGKYVKKKFTRRTQQPAPRTPSTFNNNPINARTYQPIPARSYQPIQYTSLPQTNANTPNQINRPTQSGGATRQTPAPRHPQFPNLAPINSTNAIYTRAPSPGSLQTNAQSPNQLSRQNQTAMTSTTSTVNQQTTPAVNLRNPAYQAQNRYGAVPSHPNTRFGPTPPTRYDSVPSWPNAYNARPLQAFNPPNTRNYGNTPSQTPNVQYNRPPAQ